MDKKARLLYVEDDATLSFVTRDNLEIHGFHVDYCEDGLEALKKVRSEKYDLCILDIMLPKMDGYTLAQKIREENEEVPIIFLTARSAKEDRIHGLRLGADDYITKPFSIEELVLKIGVFLKRGKISVKPPKNLIRLGNLTLDPLNLLLISDDQKKRLTYRESELLLFLAENMNQIVRREEILSRIWNNDNFFSSRSLDVFISRLRKILAGNPNVRIENIHNVGYRIRVVPSAQ